MIDLSKNEIWFLTGSQELYGEETLRQVAENSRTIAESWDRSGKLPVRVVAKPTLTGPDAILKVCLVAGHGPFTWGTTATQAVYHAAMLEQIAQMAFITRTIHSSAERIPEYLIRKHFERKHGPRATYGQG